MLAILLGASVIGLSLGILGSGGSILTVPLLTYVIGRPPKVAIAWTPAPCQVSQRRTSTLAG